MGKKKKSGDSKVSNKAVLLGELWVIAAKLHGVGDLLKMRAGDPPLNQAEVNYGIGQVIVDLGIELERIREGFEQ